MESIFIIDDQDDLCRTLERVLKREGYKTDWETDPELAIEQVKGIRPSCVLLDLKMGKMDGLSVLKEIKDFDSKIPVIMLTAYETVGSAVEAMKDGAFHYMPKPFDNEELKIIVRKAIEQNSLNKQLVDLKARLGDMDDLESFMGSSPRIQEVLKLVRSVASTNVNVLLLGESGTGKELIARTIHRSTNVVDAPFIPVDCAAIPETLIESELFGHEKGAYTGATSTQKGKFELADGGTIFLDEVGNIPSAVQAKLLRFLESHILQRIGGHKHINPNVRIIAATNVDLKQASHDKQFRLDLFYRLNEFPIILPPLRQRVEDIPLLSNRFLQQMIPDLGKELDEISQPALEALQAYHFPGNVRELRNIIKRAAVMANKRIDLADLPQEIRTRASVGLTSQIKVPINPHLSLGDASRYATEKIEVKFITDALKRTSGHQGKAAQLLGITPRTLYNKMKEHHIKSQLIQHRNAAGSGFPH